MYLVDTSVWIDFFNSKRSSVVRHLEYLLEKKISFGLTGVIYQEVLQGALSVKHFSYLKDYLCTHRFYQPKNPLETYQNSAFLYFQCRRDGITLRSAVDCIIAQIAIENGLFLLHNDKDFTRIAKVFPNLKHLDESSFS